MRIQIAEGQKENKKDAACQSKGRKLQERREYTSRTVRQKSKITNAYKHGTTKSAI